MRKHIAGHEFEGHDLDSLCVKPTPTLGQCPSTRRALFEVTEDQVKLDNIAHTSYLSAAEYTEITQAKKEYEEYTETLMAAIRELSAS